MARGRGRRWRRPAGRALLTRQAPREPGRGGEAGRERWRARVAERRAEAVGSRGQRRASLPEVGGSPAGRGAPESLPECAGA